MCCGQKRSLLQNTMVRNTMPRTLPQMAAEKRERLVQAARVAKLSQAPVVRPAPASPPSGEVAMRYLQNVPVRVRGLVSGRSYEFPGPQTVQPIDARDVPGLLNTRLFRRG